MANSVLSVILLSVPKGDDPVQGVGSSAGTTFSKVTTVFSNLVPRPGQDLLDSKGLIEISYRHGWSITYSSCQPCDAAEETHPAAYLTAWQDRRGRGLNRRSNFGF